MSRLINPGVGEIVDRLQILALKILYSEERGKSTEHFTRERAALLTKLQGRTLNAAWYEPTLALAAVHAALWHKTDQLRGEAIIFTADPDLHPQLVARLGIQIMELNDARADLVRKINELAGEAPDGEEKLR